MKILSFSQREKMYDLIYNIIDNNILTYKSATAIILNYIKIKKNIDIREEAIKSDSETLRFIYDNEEYLDLFKQSISELCILKDKEDITIYKSMVKSVHIATRYEYFHKFLIGTYEDTDNKIDRVIVKEIVADYFNFMQNNYPDKVLLTERTIINYLREKYASNYFTRIPSYIVGLKRKEDRSY